MHTVYQNPLVARYAGKEMLYLFSDDKKFTTWRRLWVALAEAEQQLGLPITDEQIAEMREHINVNDSDYETAAREERTVRHDVMAHVRAYGSVCPKAAGIIHLGATSCYVGDNADIIIMTEALRLVKSKLLLAMRTLRDFADRYKSLPTLAYTHFQPAQPTTVGKRATLWLYDLYLDYGELCHKIDNMALLGCKGTTGTSASFLALFDGDHEKCRRLERIIAEKTGFEKIQPVSGQTYARKTDTQVLNVLAGIAQSAMKFSGDIRLLQHLKEIEEPFGENQIGSSAMAYKRNPMRCERITSLARYVIADAANPAVTASTQWLERTLDDSANRRISIPEAFLAVDAILTLYINVAGGLTVYPKMIEKHLHDELPFMATENILMYAVKHGGNRQELHEAIRAHAMEAGMAVKERGGENDLIDRIAGDAKFNLTRAEIEEITKPEAFTGRSAEQVDEFLAGIIDPVLNSETIDPSLAGEVNV